MTFFDSIRASVTPEELLLLPTRHRVTWGLFCVQQVTQLCSVHFRTSFRQDEFIRLAWEWVNNGQIAPTLPESLESTHADLFQLAEEEGYSGEYINSTFYLFVEISHQNGVMASRAVESAASLFATSVLWSQGVGMDRLLPEGYWELYEMRFTEYARSIYSAILTEGTAWEINKCSNLPLFDHAFVTLEKSLLSTFTTLPPLHERRTR